MNNNKLLKQIDTFYKKNSEIYKKPLEKIINNMLEHCRYINGESLERHNFGCKPIQLNIKSNIPNNTSIKEVENYILNELQKKEIADKSILELLWGDIQLGKRVQSCIIMWFSIYILKRPVLYIFRNLNIDQQQLQDDIIGREEYNFNVKMIESIFKEFISFMEQELDENCSELYKDFILPELKNLKNKDILKKLSDKKAYNPNDIFCCLMNSTQLNNINDKFTEYIKNNDELINITILVDESDISSPTCSNDKINNKNLSDTTNCEKILAKIYKKVKYVLHITGTAHPFFWNITTMLNSENYIQLEVSKVHKMKREYNYYGLMNNKINFQTNYINNWWNNKNKYNIIDDYHHNLNNIIKIIKTRKDKKYNSLLISEEKTRNQQFELIKLILNDHPNIFVIIYHGKCLRLYFNIKYRTEIIQCVQKDGNDSKSSNRLNVIDGIIGSPELKENNKELPNNYCYYNLNTSKFNIKMVYKILSMFFKNNKLKINKTVITITGKYGERGYSFTSDDYNKYSFHLTDQYFVSHASINCTDISQRLRLQGKYNDDPVLTLWTTNNLKTIINSYCSWIKIIENNIMECKSWYEIKNLIESILLRSTLRQCLDVRKKLKNIKKIKNWDKNGNLRLINISDIDKEEQITYMKKWINMQNDLPEFNDFINDIKLINDDSYYDIIDYGIPIDFTLSDDKFNEIINKYNNKKLNKEDKESLHKLIEEYLPKDLKYLKLRNKQWVYKKSNHEIQNIKDHIKQKKQKKPNKNMKRGEYQIFLIINDIDEWECKKGECYILYNKKEYKEIKQNNINENPVQIKDEKIHNEHFFSEVKNKYINNIPSNYYYITPDNWVYIHMKNNNKIINISIIDTIDDTIYENNISESVKDFEKNNCIFTNKNLRCGIVELYNEYIKWCKINNYQYLNDRILFKQEFDKFNYNYIGQGKHYNTGRSKCRGYQLILNNISISK